MFTLEENSKAVFTLEAHSKAVLPMKHIKTLFYPCSTFKKVLTLRYLHKLFTQLSKHKGKLRVRHLPIEDVTASLPHHLEVDTLLFIES